MDQNEKDFEDSGEKLAPLAESVQQIRDEVGKVLVGQHEMLDLMIAGMLAEGHILIEGVPGIAKTLAAKALSKTISAGFSRVQFTPDLMPSDVSGTNVFNPKEGAFYFNPGPVFSNIILADEINRAPAKTQASLFEVMEERQVTVDGVTHPMDDPFMVLATQNPIEQEGTYRLPEAQLDRFIFKIEMGYPTEEEEQQILYNAQSGGKNLSLDQLKPVITPERLRELRKLIQEVRVDGSLLRYITRLIHQTRQDPDLYLGASPRASLAVLTGSKALAAMEGRDFVTPEDIQDILYPSLVHRLLLTPDKEMEGMELEEAIEQIIKQVEVPR